MPEGYIPVMRADWLLHLPEGYDYQKFRSNLKKMFKVSKKEKEKAKKEKAPKQAKGGGKKGGGKKGKKGKKK